MKKNLITIAALLTVITLVFGCGPNYEFTRTRSCRIAFVGEKFKTVNAHGDSVLAIPAAFLRSEDLGFNRNPRLVDMYPADSIAQLQLKRGDVLQFTFFCDTYNDYQNGIPLIRITTAFLEDYKK